MNRVLIASILSCLLLLSSCGGGSSSESHAALDQMVKEQWSKYQASIPQSAGGVALYMITPQGSYFSSYGIAEASPNIHFRVASNTKTFTSSAIMLLHQEGKLNINDFITAPIPGTAQPYVPDTPEYAIPYKSQITIRQLLSHRAGVFDISNNAIPATCDAPYAGGYYDQYVRATDEQHTFTFEELIGVIAHCQLSFFAPGTDYHYSNNGFSLLGKIIERVSGKSYSRFIKDRFIDPNGLSETSVPYLGTDNALPAPFAPGNYISEGSSASWTEDNMSLNVAEGNIISTPANLAHWIRALISGQAGLNSDSISEMTTCATSTSASNCYGLGVYEQLTPITGYGHNGAHIGYLSLMMHDPENQVTTVIFSSLLNFDDVTGEAEVQASIWEKAYEILGYTKAGVSKVILPVGKEE